jgi:diketogulonate reductase-like aldo/keto reductase
MENETAEDFIQISDKKILLNNGNEIPIIGLGVSQIKEQNSMDETIKAAYETGYRLIDTAIVYLNEHLLGESLKKLNIPREEIFLTTKIHAFGINGEIAKDNFEESLLKLQTDYIDLLLLHWPGFNNVEDRVSAWKTLEDLYQKGKAKNIGVSNFLPHHIQTLIDNGCKIIPQVNQIEYHPLYIDSETINKCEELNIKIQAYSPLGRFHPKLIKNEKIEKIALKYNKSVPQILIRWNIQHDNIVLTKSVKKERLEENINVGDFEISYEDMKELDSLNVMFKTIDKWDPRSVKY